MLCLPDNSPRRPGTRCPRLVALVGLTILAGPLAIHGCTASDVYRTRLRSSNPLERAKAVVALAEMGDAESVHHLVDLLEDRDPAVRLFAIEALKRLVGQDYGYRYYHDETRRIAAVDRWRQALRAGEVSVHPADGPTADGAATGQPGGRAVDAVEEGADEPGEPGAAVQASSGARTGRQDFESP